MFGLFRKKKRKIINPYTLPNVVKEYHSVNIFELHNNLNNIENDLQQIYYTNFNKRYIKRHMFFTDYNGNVINNIEEVVDDLYSKIESLSKKYKKGKTIKDIDALTRIHHILEELKKSFSDIVE